MTNEDRTLIEEKFRGLTTLLNAQFGAVNDRLDRLNSKVADHESKIGEALVERSKNRQKQDNYFTEIDVLKERVREMEKIELTHVINCPVSPKLRLLEDQMLTNKALKKYVAVMFTSGLALGSLIVGILKLVLG